MSTTDEMLTEEDKMFIDWCAKTSITGPELECDNPMVYTPTEADRGAAQGAVGGGVKGEP